ncbi:calmodulin-like [Nymphaea colorata]|uniref:calmodulin-like n=1 Tax=Nymphaea colorata TaxID=210225 RepID=UPI00129E1863|nr:calmodulin-like [Nymphaea colorata]
MSQFSGADLAGFRELFDYYDRDHDGVITKADSMKAMQSVGYNVVLESNLFEGINSADFELFSQAIETNTLMISGNLKEELSQGFEFFNEYRAGKIYAGELRHLLTTLRDKLSDGELKVRIGEDKVVDSPSKAAGQLYKV